MPLLALPGLLHIKDDHLYTWIRFTITEQRLSGLRTLSIHRRKIQDLNLVENVVNIFSKKLRDLQFMFEML